MCRTHQSGLWTILHSLPGSSMVCLTWRSTLTEACCWWRTWTMPVHPRSSFKGCRWFSLTCSSSLLPESESADTDWLLASSKNWIIFFIIFNNPPIHCALQVLQMRSRAEEFSRPFEPPAFHSCRSADMELWPPHRRPYPSSVRMIKAVLHRRRPLFIPQWRHLHNCSSKKSCTV